MEKTNEIRGRIRKVLQNLFHLKADAMRSNLKMGDPPEWDSLGHMQLIVEIEKEFGLRFPSHMLSEMVSEEAIAKAVQNKAAQK